MTSIPTGISITPTVTSGCIPPARRLPLTRIPGNTFPPVREWKIGTSLFRRGRRARFRLRCSTATGRFKSAFIYATVLEGAIRTSVNDGPPVIYKAGQNFPEFPGDRHTLDENASKTDPAKLLAVLVVDTDTKEPLLTPIHNHK